MRPVAVDNPANRFSTREVAWDGEVPEQDLEIIEDHARSILSKNDSPDVPFTYSVNAYRGCLHACAYCYARPTHEYLGYGAGSDFDRKIIVKPRAAELLREAFDKKSWRGDAVVMSGVTDCYQPVEARYELTRQCLEVCLEYKNPVGIITKSPLIERDIDLLVALAAVTDVHVAISVGTWNEAHARAIEPYVATPARRMKTIERLAAAGLTPTVMVAPLIPGLSEEDIPKVLSAAKRAGAASAGRTVLRLPGAVRGVFASRIKASLPLRADKIIARTRELYGGKDYDSTFGVRGRGEGTMADVTARLFDATAERLGFQRRMAGEVRSTFERPKRGQLDLF